MNLGPERHNWGFFGDHIDLPTPSGRPEIVDAVGNRNG